MDQQLKVEPAMCHACGKQVWVGVLNSSHFDFIGGTLEQDHTGAFRPSVKHQYTIHEHQPGER